ncbi:tumor necrosis factor ligand superfamily member 6-like [Lissotriton helveticus]
MQQNLNYVYPSVFWVDGVAGAPPASTGPPLPLRRPVKRRTAGTWLCLFAVTVLVFLALTGVGLGYYKIVQLQNDLDRMKKPFASSDGLTSFLEKHTGLPNLLAAKQHPRRAAHLTGKSNANSLPLDWEDTHGRAFLDGVRYVNRGLVINETGLYFVYSTVYFRWKTCENKPLIHTVFKRTQASRNDVILLEGRKINYCGNNRVWARSSSLAAVFNLTRFESLYVNVSDISLVGFDETKTFFGLYKL